MYTTSLFLVAVFVSSCFSVHLPSNFPKCNRKQPDINNCLSNAIKEVLSLLNKPYPELGLPNFSPLTISEVSIAAGTSAVDFRQDYKNLKAYKLNEVSSLKASMNFDKNVLELEIEHPKVDFSFDYNINGKILLLPIKGRGSGNISIGNSLIKVTFMLEEKNNHYKVVDTKMHYEKIEDFHVKFDNLFNGDKALGENINDVINKNWRDVFDDVKEGYETAGATTFQSILNNFFAKVTVVELFGEP